MTDSETIVDAWFRSLAGQCPDTAAEAIPLVMRSDKIQGDNNGIAYRHNDFFSLYITQRGRGTHIIDGVPYGVARGDVYAMGIGMRHHFWGCENLVMHTLHFAPAIFDPPTLDALTETPGFQSLFVEEPLHRADHGGGGRWLHLTPDAYAPVEEELTELRAEWSSGTPGGTLLTRGLFLRLLVHLARHYARSQENGTRPTAPPSAPREATVAAALRYMEEHFTEPVRIERVAASVFLSPDRFTEVFAAAMGRTPRDYLRHLRIERAKALLAATDLTVAEIARQSGFGEPAYFTRAFRAATGTTPRRFRRG